MKQLRKIRCLRGALVVLLLFQILLVQAMAVSGDLHHDLHCDADHGDHQCEVTLFQSGAVDSGTPEPLVLEAPAATLPEFRPVMADAPTLAMHLRGGVLANAPSRAP